VILEDLRRVAERVLRRDAAVRRDLERERVVIGALADVSES